MYIAPRVTAAQWKGLRLDHPNSADWSKAVEILESRIGERFIEPIDFLIASESSTPAIERRFGFTVLAIDCLLVETIGALIDGLESTEGKSKAIFCKFLTTRPKFAQDFKSGDLANKFYEDFRCGILHQAEVGGNSKVWSVGSLLQVDGGKIIVNRTEFHTRLKAEFQSYLDELRDPQKSMLRENFRKKMDFISRR